MTPTFKNKNFTKRNYECTNVAACQLVGDGAKVPENYEAADESILFGIARESGKLLDVASGGDLRD